MKFILILLLSFLMVINITRAQTNNHNPNETSTFEIFSIAPEIKIIRIQPSVYVIEDLGGLAPSYSMIVDISDDNLLLVDTTDPEKTISILQWAHKKFNGKKIVAINTHHHSDRTGGNTVLIEQGIPVYGSDLTALLATEENEIAPNHTFPIQKGKTLNFDNKEVLIFHPGPAHTADNVVVYIPYLKLLFGGCMVVPFQKVYRVPDANIDAWPNSLAQLKQFDVEWVIPGHPANLSDDLNFSPSLIEHTEMLLKTGKTGEFTASEAQALRNRYKLEIALSFDDAPRPDGAIFTGAARTQQIIDILDKKNVKEVAIFANSRDFTIQDQARLEQYAIANHIIANHTAHHLNLHDKNITSEIFVADIDEADKELRQFKTYHRWFRYPYLRQAHNINDENDIQIQNHLMKEEYKHGYVTVETYDWHLDHLMSEDIKNGVPINFKKLREVYIEILWDGIIFYDDLAKNILGRSPKHVLLLHENDLNALFIGDLIDHIRKNGGEIIPVTDAYTDPIAMEKYDTLRLSQRRLRAIAKDLDYKGPTSSQFEEQENIEQFYKSKMNN